MIPYSDDPRGHYAQLLENIKQNWEKKFGYPMPDFELRDYLQKQIAAEKAAFLKGAVGHLAGAKAEGFLGLLYSREKPVLELPEATAEQLQVIKDYAEKQAQTQKRKPGRQPGDIRPDAPTL